MLANLQDIRVSIQIWSQIFDKIVSNMGLDSNIQGHALQFSRFYFLATDHEDILLDKRHNEVNAGRMSGPYFTLPMPDLHVTPIGVVPKADGGWRMITHLSYPPSASINDHIDPQFTSVTYTSFDTVVQTISTLGQGVLIARPPLRILFA